MKFKLATILLLCTAAVPSADTVVVGSLERKGADIKILRGDTLVFEIAGRLNEVPAAKISRLAADSDPALNDAENNFATGNFDDAVDQYQKAIRTTGKAWVRDWCAMRLIAAASKSGRFDAASAAYVITLLRDPATTAAKPPPPDSKSTFLDSAAANVKSSLQDSHLTIEQRRALLNYLVELQQARKDSAGEDAAYEQLAKLPDADASNINANRILAMRRLAMATRDLSAKNYSQAIADIESARSVFVDPQQQADALFDIAQARAGLAENDSTALKDAAIAYMRVVTVAKNIPGQPHVAASLFATAAILNRLGENASAAKLCRQIIAESSNDPAAADARTLLAQLTPTTETSTH